MNKLINVAAVCFGFLVSFNLSAESEPIARDYEIFSNPIEDYLTEDEARFLNNQAYTNSKAAFKAVYIAARINDIHHKYKTNPKQFTKQEPLGKYRFKEVQLSYEEVLTSYYSSFKNQADKSDLSTPKKVASTLGFFGVVTGNVPLVTAMGRINMGLSELEKWSSPTKDKYDNIIDNGISDQLGRSLYIAKNYGGLLGEIHNEILNDTLKVSPKTDFSKDPLVNLYNSISDSKIEIMNLISKGKIDPNKISVKLLLELFKGKKFNAGDLEKLFNEPNSNVKYYSEQLVSEEKLDKKNDASNELYSKEFGEFLALSLQSISQAITVMGGDPNIVKYIDFATHIVVVQNKINEMEQAGAGMATGMITLNYLQLFFSFVSLVNSTKSKGPSFEEIVIEQLQAIQEQLVSLSEQINENHLTQMEKMSQIHTVLIDGIDNIITYNRMKFNTVIERSNNLVTQINSIMNSNADTKYSNFSRYLHQCFGERIDGTQIGQFNIYVNNPYQNLPVKKFNSCFQYFYHLLETEWNERLVSLFDLKDSLFNYENHLVDILNETNISSSFNPKLQYLRSKYLYKLYTNNPIHFPRYFSKREIKEEACSLRKSINTVRMISEDRNGNYDPSKLDYLVRKNFKYMHPSPNKKLNITSDSVFKKIEKDVIAHKDLHGAIPNREFLTHKAPLNLNFKTNGGNDQYSYIYLCKENLSPLNVYFIESDYSFPGLFIEDKRSYGRSMDALKNSKFKVPPALVDSLPQIAQWAHLFSPNMDENNNLNKGQGGRIEICINSVELKLSFPVNYKWEFNVNYIWDETHSSITKRKEKKIPLMQYTYETRPEEKIQIIKNISASNPKFSTIRQSAKKLKNNIFEPLYYGDYWMIDRSLKNIFSTNTHNRSVYNPSLLKRTITLNPENFELLLNMLLDKVNKVYQRVSSEFLNEYKEVNSKISHLSTLIRVIEDMVPHLEVNNYPTMNMSYVLKKIGERENQTNSKELATNFRIITQLRDQKFPYYNVPKHFEVQGMKPEVYSRAKLKLNAWENLFKKYSEENKKLICP